MPSLRSNNSMMARDCCSRSDRGFGVDISTMAPEATIGKDNAQAYDINLPSAEEGPLPFASSILETFQGFPLVTSCEDTSPRIHTSVSRIVTSSWASDVDHNLNCVGPSLAVAILCPLQHNSIQLLQSTDLKSKLTA
jgi:hypothetical protein